MNTPSFAEQPLAITYRPPARICRTGPDSWFIDFGLDVFGWAEIRLPGPAHDGAPARLRLGEQLAGPMKIDRNPGGCIRFCDTSLGQPAAEGWRRSLIPPDERNTGPRAIRMPPSIGEVLPFRYCEIEGIDGDLDPSCLRQAFVHYPFNDDASDFLCSDPLLNDIWKLCKHTIKATTFCGLYVDGDRERIPYEGDAYINQLSHYCVDAEYGVARRTHEYLLYKATWPTDWLLQSVFMAWYDFLYTSDDQSLRNHYDLLKLKTLTCLAREDGLISPQSSVVTPELKRDLGLDDFFAKSNLKDNIDWPQPGFQGHDILGETDGYEFTDYNTAINALHYRALILMARIADQLGKKEDLAFYNDRAAFVKRTINEKLFNPELGLYVDGLDSTHSSQHANFFPLMAGCVPTERLSKVVKFIASRGMACSVYGAQHLLDGLYKANADEIALDLMLSTDRRSWANMLYRARSTMTLEAWDPVYKPNLDFNHAWGAAPANIIMRRLMGVRPTSPGFATCAIAPQPGHLEWAHARVPTPHGPIELEFCNTPGKPLEVAWSAPDGVEAKRIPNTERH